MTHRRKARFGWRPSPPDIRDFKLSVPGDVLQNLPPSVDLRSQCPPILDQGQIGSCTANALSAAVQFDRMKQGLQPSFVPSRLFIYFNERTIEGDVPLDGGAFLRDGIKSLASQGVCPEDQWPYVPTPPFVDGGAFPTGSAPVTQPPQSCYDTAANYRIAQYQAVDQSLPQLRGTLAQGNPFVFGFSVYTNWDDGQSTPATVIPLPSGDASQNGGHAVMVVGYDDSKSLFTIHNSWGTDLGDSGYFYMPYAYATDSTLASDFWVIQTTSD
jgi:C1A family cysteine protease